MGAGVTPEGTDGDQLAWYGAAYYATRYDRRTTCWTGIEGTFVTGGTRAECLYRVRGELAYQALKYDNSTIAFAPGFPEDNLFFAGHHPMIRVMVRPLPATFWQYEWVPSVVDAKT